MENKLLEAENKLYNSKLNKLDKNLKNLIRTQRDIASAYKIDDELER